MKIKFLHGSFAMYLLLATGVILSSCQEKKQYKDIIYTKPEIVKDPDKVISYGVAPFNASIDLKTCSGYIKLPLAIPAVLIVAIF